MQATPLQLAQATALIASKGKWNRPHLAKTVEGVRPVDENPMEDIVLRDKADWNRVTHGMEMVMHGARGTARKAAIGAQYRIAGKSGTAQVVAIKQGEKYDRNKVQERHRDHALFVSFAPAENPKIVVSVMVENGESGSGVAAPVVRQRGRDAPPRQLPAAHPRRRPAAGAAADPGRRQPVRAVFGQRQELGHAAQAGVLFRPGPGVDVRHRPAGA
uniref:Transpeptidase domain-containing protein n=1 Tax=Steinernema glaseri TaxID=37863 RepID=A0A1I8AIV5_9BILA